ncbi:MAG: M48 family metalloprotease [Deltaproteobacteria bacterium]|nr:M48 family metalloprotease [Deltaproteobacteria bacterium]
MNASFMVLALAAFSLATVAVSAFGGCAVPLLARSAAGLAPTARVRLSLMLAASPLVAGLLFVGAAMVPWLVGLDHCVGHGGHHPHLCPVHAHAPPAVLWIAAAWPLARLALALWSFATGIVAARRGEALLQMGDSHRPVVAIHSPEAVAFTLGLVRPRAYVSDGIPAEHLAAVTAHELAHVATRDPLVRSLAKVALAFHLPGIDRRIARELAAAQEHAADEAAARALGDRLRVAEAILAVVRLRTAPVCAALFEGPTPDARVAALLTPPRVDVARTRTLAALLALACATALAAADPVHHAIETALGVLAGR